jgi:predicted NAD/FAD-binding protein
MTSARPLPPGSRVAVIGSGAAALGAALTLSQRHHVTILERDGHAGGHANTLEVARTDGGRVAVDTGFIVYNQRTYPNLIRLFDHLKVATQATDMSFGVSLDGGTLEYSGESLTGLFGQPVNLLRPRFLGMVKDILRFYREAPALLARSDSGPSLGDYLAANRYGEAFIDDHLLPMAAAIWSAPAATMMAFPAISFVRFCTNHGLLQLTDRPQWRTVVGGSREYVSRLLERSHADLWLNAAVAEIRRLPAGVAVVTKSGRRDRFDHVVVGTHADEALAMLADPTEAERRLLGAFGYQKNLAVLHSDPSLMPRRRALWASWNYLGATGPDGARRLSVTYWMNRLQALDPTLPLFVTLNPACEPQASAVHARIPYHHPVFDARAMAAQRRLKDIQGVDRVSFCGSYFGYGFHEDALAAGLAAATALGCPAPWADLTAQAAE